MQLVLLLVERKLICHSVDYCGVLLLILGFYMPVLDCSGPTAHEAWAFGCIKRETAESWPFSAIPCQNKWQQDQYCLA